MITAETIAKRAVLSDALLRRLHLIAHGKAAQLASRTTIATVALDGILLERGLVRTVKHRDFTRTYALTPAGAEAINNHAAENQSVCTCGTPRPDALSGRCLSCRRLSARASEPK